MARKPAAKPSPPSSRPKRVIPTKSETVTSSPSPVKKSAVKKSPSVIKAKSTTTRKSKKNASKPTYERMIYKALKDLGGRTVHSSVAIAKWIESNYPVPEESFKRSVRSALKRGVQDGLFVQNKASFKLSSKGIEKNGGKGSSGGASGYKRKRTSTARDGQPSKRTTKNSKKAGTVEEPKKSSRSKVQEAATVPTAKSSRAPKATKASTVTDKVAKPKAAKSAKKRSPKSDKSEVASESSNSNVVKKPHGIIGDHMWQYDDKGWKNYDIEASNTVEKVYQDYLANRGETDVRAVKSGSWEYMVDFMAMKQTNIQHDNHTIRSIRRIPVSE